MKKFIVEYAIYTNQGIVKPDRFNRRKSFPTIQGAFGFWKRKALDNRGVAHIIHKNVLIHGSTIKQIINREGDLEAYFNKMFN